MNKPHSTNRRLAALFRDDWPALAAALALCATGAALSVLGPLLLGRATDLIVSGIRHATTGPAHHGTGTATGTGVGTGTGTGTGTGRFDFAALDRLLLLVLAVYAGAALFNLLGVRLAIRAVERTVYRLRARLQAKLTRLSFAHLDRQPRGDLLSRATNDLDSLAQTGHQVIGQIVNSVVTITGVLAMMFWLSPLLALLTLVLVPVSAGVTRVLGKRARQRFATQAAATGALSAHVEEMYTGHALVRLFGLRDEAAERFRRHNAELRDAASGAQLMSGLIEPAMGFLGSLGYVLIAVVGGLRIASGALSVGEVQAFVQYSRQFSLPLTQLAGVSALVQSGLASGERILELLDAEEQQPDPSLPARPAETRGAVAFERVSFRYDPEQPLIEDFSLEVAPGHTVAVVGPTGAGKTTLTNLLLRFYEPTRGRIILDGVDIAAMTRAELSRRVGLVLQDTWLFQGTIEENIAYGRPGATRAEVEAAARAAHADHFVRTLPAGYRTVLGEDDGAGAGSSGISAGERQLITIARAFLADPPVLVLDEATSSVDGRTEALVRRALAALRAGRTTFLIAHRLTTVQSADTILVLHDGAIVEQGTHPDLLAADGPYARLHGLPPARPSSAVSPSVAAGQPSA